MSEIAIPNHPDPQYRPGHYCFDVEVMWDAKDAPEVYQVWAETEEQASRKVGDVISEISDLAAEGNDAGRNFPPDGACISVVSVSAPYVPEVPPWAR